MEWKISLNAGKSEVSTFSRDTKDAKSRPTILVGGKAITFNPTPRLLGVILDRQLTFTPHMDELIRRVGPSFRMLRAVSHSEWGWPKKTLKSLYYAFVNSHLSYAGAGWQPYICAKNREDLIRLQNKALRAITGQLISTPVEALRLEAGIQSYDTHSKRLLARSWEKALRCPADHPRRATADESVDRRTTASCWRSSALSLLSQLPPELSNRQQLEYYNLPPWQESCSGLSIYPHVPGIKGRSDDPALKRIMSLEQIRSFSADIILYTDGSAQAGMEDGGYGGIVTTGDPEDLNIIDEFDGVGRKFTSSFLEEKAALENALRWLVSHDDDPSRVALICTDSQSLCFALLGNDLQPFSKILSTLAELKSTLSLQWIPGHSELPGNEAADARAKEAAKNNLNVERPPISLEAASTVIKRFFKDPQPEHERVRKVYSQLSHSRDAEQLKSRSDQVLLARLRSGHHPGLRAYMHRLDPQIDEQCYICGEGQMTLDHWLICCPGISAERVALFGTHRGRLEWLCEEPLNVVALARRTLRDPHRGEGV